MITNERQYKITKNQIERFRSALHEFDEINLAKKGIDPRIIEAQRESLEQQLVDLEKQISTYERLKSGKITRLFPSNVTDIGQKLIDARISQGLSQRSLAERLGMKEQQIQRYEQEKYLTANLTRVAEVAEALRLDLVAFFEARDQRTLNLIAPNLKGISDFDRTKLPVKEMKKRGWLERTQLLDTLDAFTDEDLAVSFVSQAMQGYSSPSLHKQHVRAGSKQDPYALLAWKSQILTKARKVVDRHQLRDRPLNLSIIEGLSSLSALNEGPVKAVEVLLEHGIVVVFEQHLPSTHLDGAAMLLDEATPIIGLTLRHDRLDNFWFVLLHELGHIALHREQGLKDGFYDDEESVTLDGIEKEADEFAKCAFVADEVWNRAFVRFTADRKQVQQFAIERGIGAAVVAGRIRRERNDYSIFTDLVGFRTVRNLMAESGYWEN